MFFTDGRKRIKSDSDIQRSRKMSFKRNLEEHVLYALENFFTIEPSRLGPLPRIILSKSELNESLIADNDDADEDDDIDDTLEKRKELTSDDADELKEDEEFETSFMGGKPSYSPLEVKYDQPEDTDDEDSGKMKTGTDESIGEYYIKEKLDTMPDKRSVSCSEVSTRLSVDIKTDRSRVLSDMCSKEYDKIKSSSGGVSLVDEVIEETAKDAIKGQILETNASTREAKISINVDVHNCLESPSVVDEDLDNDVFFNRSLSEDASNGQNMKAGTSSLRSQGIKLEKQVRWDNQIPGSDIELELDNIGDSEHQPNASQEDAKELSNEVKGDDEDEEIVEDVGGDRNEVSDGKVGEISFDKDRRRFSDDIAEDNQEEIGQKRKEVLTFQEYSQKYLIKPFKDVMFLMLTYCICMLPQIVLDIYRMIKGDTTLTDSVDGMLSIFSDVTMSVFLLAVSVVSVWRFQKKTRVSEQRHWWLNV